jgi:hypothetical protein
MKLFNPLWRDPVGWAEQVAKTKLRVGLYILIHILFVAGGLAGIYWLLRTLPGNSEVTAYLILVGACPIIFIGIGFPAMYLYSMHRLLKILREVRLNEKASTY